MFGTLVTARHKSIVWLLLILVAGAIVTVTSPEANAEGSFDITSIPRPEGAQVDADRSSSSSVTFTYPASVSAASLATEKVLNSKGWLRYQTPDQPQSDRYKSGSTAIYVSVNKANGKGDLSRIVYSHNNSIPANVPFPDDAIDIIFDENRPFLRCATGMSIESALDFFIKGLASEGWSLLDAEAIPARWPSAKLEPSIEDGRRVYFQRDVRYREWAPVRLTLQRNAGGKTIIDIRTAPFALPQDLPFYQDFAGLPASDHYKRSGGEGSADSERREATALVMAEIPVVLAFYRRELGKKGYQEQLEGANIGSGLVKITFKKPDDTAVLELREVYDLTEVRLIAQLSKAAVAARARAKQDADASWLRDARRQAEELIDASEAKRLAAATAMAKEPVETLRPSSNSNTPIPVPENASDLDFNGDDGKLEFSLPSTPKSVAGFFRSELKGLGWKEKKTVINKPTMVRLEFSKGAKKISLTVMLFGEDTRVSADGTGLQVPADPNREIEHLEGDDVGGFPVPKKHSMSAPGAWNSKGSKVAFRRDYAAQVPADIGSVLAFYRRELAKRNWSEQAAGAVIKPDDVQLAFNAPEGPAQLKLGRMGKETTVSLVVKNPLEAEKARVLPAAGKAKVILGNLGDDEASITIAKKSFKVEPGAGGSETPDGPMLDLVPGKYKYVMKIAGKSKVTGDIEVHANDTWGLMIGPGGVLALQIY